MPTPPNLPPVDIQKRYISGNINSTMLLSFLMGIYTMFYGVTMYLYSSKKPVNRNRLVVLLAISVLYLLCLLNFKVEWYLIDWAIVLNGDTRASMYLGTGHSPPWADTLRVFVVICLFIVSDGLLIWRCYHVWARNFWAILVPSLFLVAEIGLSITSMVLLVSLLSNRNESIDSTLYNNVVSALSFSSLATTITTTFLIGYKIHFASRFSGPPAKTLYNRVMATIVESAAVYSLVLLCEAVILESGLFNVSGSPLALVQSYAGAVLPIVAGMAPTAVVSRTALTDPHSTSSSRSITHISGLQFCSHQHSASARSVIATRMLATDSVQADDVTPVLEIKRESIDSDAFVGVQT